jgi:hypothetical protein
MSRAALILILVMVTCTTSESAQIAPVDDRAVSGRFIGSNCDPTGNIDEVAFEADSVPLEEWLKERRARQISIDMRVRGPELRMDQQNTVFYAATVQMKSQQTTAEERKVAFFVGVDSAAGKRLTETSVHAVDVPAGIQGTFEITVFGCIYFQPGNYSLWVAAYDQPSGKHGVQRQNVRVSGIKNDPLPLIESQLPAARFPDYTPEETDLLKVLPTSLFLPVANKRPLAVDIISLNPQQRNGIGPLSQMTLRDSSLSVTTLDLETQKVVYDSRITGTFDFTEMLKAAELHKQNDRTIDLSVLLERRNGAAYVRKFLEQRMKSAEGKACVIFVVSSPMTFQRGADISPIEMAENCRLYYVQMLPGGGRDDLERLLKSDQSRRFEVNSALEFRKALATIVRELEAY